MHCNSWAQPPTSCTLSIQSSASHHLELHQVLLAASPNQGRRSCQPFGLFGPRARGSVQADRRTARGGIHPACGASGGFRRTGRIFPSHEQGARERASSCEATRSRRGKYLYMQGKCSLPLRSLPRDLSLDRRPLEARGRRGADQREAQKPRNPSTRCLPTHRQGCERATSGDA